MRISKTSLIIPVLILSFGLCGCFPKPPELIKHPDAPMLVLEIKGEYARVALYDKAENRLIEFGWISLQEYKGWTLTKYDWEAFIERNR